MLSLVPMMVMLSKLADAATGQFPPRRPSLQVAINDDVLPQAQSRPRQGDNLHASEMGLQESMRPLDPARGKPVANEAPIEHPPVSHEQTDEGDKGTLH